MPFAHAEFDVVTCIYLFHELPPRIRRAAVAEIRRLLRPGGTLIFVDSLQTGDEPVYYRAGHQVQAGDSSENRRI